MLLEAKAIEAEAARLSEAAAAREVEAKKAADATAKALVTAQKDQVDQNTTSMQVCAYMLACVCLCMWWLLRVVVTSTLSFSRCELSIRSVYYSNRLFAPMYANYSSTSFPFPKNLRNI